MNEKYGLKRVKRMGEIAFRGGGKDSSPRISTPHKFQDLLIKLASSVGEPNAD